MSIEANVTNSVEQVHAVTGQTPQLVEGGRDIGPMIQEAASAMWAWLNADPRHWGFVLCLAAGTYLLARMHSTANPDGNTPL